MTASDRQAQAQQTSQPIAGHRVGSGKVRDAYLAGTRLRVAAIVARIAAFLLFAGFLGSLFTWGKEHSIFEMASNSVETARPGVGYVVGPLLIVLLVPLVRRMPLARTGENPWLAYKSAFRVRIAIVTLLYFAGIVALAVSVVQLDPSYAIKAGTYAAAALLSAGLVATLAMWPAGLPTIRVDRGGRVPANTPREGGEPEGEAPGPQAPEAEGQQPQTEAAATAPEQRPPQAQPPSGWYPNPGGAGKRYWDGVRWTEQYSPAPAPPAPKGGGQGKGPRAAVWVASIVGALLLGAIAFAAFHDLVLEGNEQSQEAQAGRQADRAYQRLTGAIDRTEHQGYLAVHRAFGRLARVSTAHPYGGPELARCTPLCESSAATVRRSRRHLEATYRSTPAYLRRIYRRAFRSTVVVLGAEAAYLDAMAEWTRVHGASEYEGAAEFELMRQRADHLEAVSAENQRHLRRARRHWHRYAKRRWDLRYH